MNQRALITGVAGFAGSFLAEQLLDAGADVLGCTLDGAWHAASPPSLGARVPLLAWDLAAEPSADVCRAIAEFSPTVIYHLAAVSVPSHCGSAEPTPAALAINVGGTRRLLDLARTLVPPPRVLLVSSSHVYQAVRPESPQIDEHWPTAPYTGYGKTKLLAEQEARRAVETWGCPVVIARAFQHAGPRQNPEMMLAQWARQVAEGRDPIDIYTRQANLDVADVRDVVRAYRLLAAAGQPGEAYNIGSGIPRSSGAVFDLLVSLSASRPAIREVRPGAKQEPVADYQRLHRLTGWRPEIALERTVADTLAWWRTFAAASR